MKKTVVTFCLFLVISPLLFAQMELVELEKTDIHPKLINEKITIDGALTEDTWKNAEVISNFWQKFPTDSIFAMGQTEVLLAYDQEFLYVAAKCYSSDNKYIIPSLKRDFTFPGNDNLTFLFDTFNDKTNAIVFGMNPYGVRREALISNGGREFGNFQSSWDNKWYGEAQMHEDYWVVEAAIPFRTLRFQEGSTQWRFNIYRNDTQFNEMSTWTQIPRNRTIMDLSFMGRIVWDQPLQKPGKSISVIPYLTAGASRDFEDPLNNNTDYNIDAGFDAKIAVTSGLNLDLTINPDFSQVEVDQQVTNLDRFEIFFPERRQFFLENADLFGSFGNTRVNPFFSRRIGVAIDTATGQNIQNPIIYGARLSGKLNENLRVGVLNMQTAKEGDSGLPAFNYSVATLQQKVFNRSNVSFIFINKQAVNPDESSGTFNDYNRVAGLEYNLATADNRWTGKFFYHHVFAPEKHSQSFVQTTKLEYIHKKYRFEWAQMMLGNGYDAEVGFVPRKDFFLMSPEAGLFFYPSKGIVNQHSLNLDTRFFLQIGKDGNQIIDHWGLAERQFQFTWDLQFENNTRGNVTVTDNDLTLLNNFDPTRLQDSTVFLPQGSDYHFIDVSAKYSSDQRKSVFYEIGPSIGQFYNGIKAGFAGSLNYRFQPYGSIALNVNYDYIKLDNPFEAARIWLVGPRFDFTFSKSIFLTTFVQYNNQLDNLNINTRFQWRFAPVSDFFIVYTDNYLVDSFSQFNKRNRALVAKLTYWINL